VGQGQAHGQIRVLRLQHRQRDECRAAAQTAREPALGERHVKAPQNRGYEGHGKPRRLPAEEGVEPRWQEGESDPGGDGRDGVARQVAREPVGRKARGGEREQNQEVVGGVRAENR
jgi:hypothetical protein